MGGKARIRCLALRPPATDPQVESALNLGPTLQVDVGHAINSGTTLQVDVGHATVLVACRNVATRTAGAPNPAPPPPTCGRLNWSRSCTPHVGACIASAALRQQCVTRTPVREHPASSSWSCNLAWRRPTIRAFRAATLIPLLAHMRWPAPSLGLRLAGECGWIYHIRPCLQKRSGTSHRMLRHK